MRCGAALVARKSEGAIAGEECHVWKVRVAEPALDHRSR